MVRRSNNAREADYNRTAALPLQHLWRHIRCTVQGFHKILKKHDKKLPHAPCMQFYVSHLHQQPWVQVNLLA